MFTEEKKEELMALSKIIDQEILKKGYIKKTISINKEHYQRLNIQKGDHLQTPNGFPLKIEKIAYKDENSQLMIVVKSRYLA